MECNKVQEKLSALIDGILSQDEKMLVEEHLKSCEKCREALSELKKTIGHIKNQEEIEPPSWLTQKVMAKIRAEAAPKKGLFEKLFYPLHIKLPLGAVATIAIAVTTIYIFKSIQPEIQLAKAPSEEIIERKVQPPVIARDEVTSSKGRYIRGEKQPEPAVPEPKIFKDKADSYLTKKEVIQTERDKAYVSGEGTPITGKPSEQPMPAKEPESMKFAAPKAPAPVMKEDKAMPSAGAVVKEESKRKALPMSQLKATTEINTPKELVEKYCYEDFNGAFLSSDNYERSDIGKYIIAAEYETPGWDIVILISEYKISSIDTDIKTAKILVEYQVIGKLSGGVDLKLKKSIETYIFRLKKQGENWKIVKPYNLPPHISVTTSIRHLEELIATQGEVQPNAKTLIKKLKNL